MVIQRVISVEIDACPGCRGIVLDKGESEVIEALGVTAVIESPEVAEQTDPGGPRDNKARCYECNQDMVALVGAGDIEYDWCDKCERMFFDRGELSRLDAFKAE